MDARQVARRTLEKELDAGLVDEHVRLWLRDLNALPGITTEYSCHGHKEIGSPMAYVILILDAQLIEEFYKHRRVFLRDAPFPLTLEFQHRWVNPDNKPHHLVELYERVWVNGDVDHIGEACAPMFVHLLQFLEGITYYCGEVTNRW